MPFSPYDLLDLTKAPGPLPLHFLSPVMAQPVFSARRLERAIGPIAIRHETRSERKACKWAALDSPLKIKEPALRRERCIRRVSTLSSAREECAGDLFPLELADVWCLLAYLIYAGPIPTPIAALKPFMHDGYRYVALWQQELDGAFGIKLILARTQNLSNRFALENAHSLMCEFVK